MDNKIWTKLKEMRDDEMADEGRTVSIFQLERVEKKYGFKIPDAYKEFITKNKYSYLKDDYYFPLAEKSVFTPENGFEFIDLFIESSEIVSEIEGFLECDPDRDHVIPIAESCGNQVCIGVREHNYGKIFMLYHEDTERKDGLYLIADSFEDFILSFRYMQE